MGKVEFIDCEGCGKKLEDSYRERAIVLFADKEFKICPGRRRDYACEPSAACHQKLLRKLSDTCCGCGESSVPHAGQVCADCKKAIARSRGVDKPVQWVGLDPYYFFTRNYLSDSEAALEAVRLLARAVKGARRLTDDHDCDGSVTKLGGDHPKVYVEADEDQLEALRQLQMTLARVGDDLQRDGVKRGTDLLGRLARGDVKPDDFEQWESKNKPMTEFRSLLLEYKERGLSDEELTRELGATSTNLHYWRQGEYEPSRALQERAVAFMVEKIRESKSIDTENNR